MRKSLKNYFIPHDGNDYKPHILQKTAVVLMGVLVLLSFTLANLHALLWMNSNWLVGTILPAVVVDLTNENRDTDSLGTLSRSSTLDQAAQLKAEHMAKHEYFAHYAPDGTSPWYFFDSVSYEYVHAGENLAVHFSDSDEVVEAWMKSPSHRENIMNGKYTEIGVGTARGEYQGYPTIFVVQLFGTPANAPIAVATSEPVVPEPAPVVALAEPEPEVLPVVETPAEVVSEPVEEPVITEPVATEPAVEVLPEVEPIEITEDTTLVVSDIAEDTQEVSEVAGIDFIQPAYAAETNPVSSAARLATQPQRLLNIVYGFTALFVLMALAASILIEIRKQHPIQIAYGTGLIAAMIALMYIHLAITGGALIA